jgi:hypothetical protein
MKLRLHKAPDWAQLMLLRLWKSTYQSRRSRRSQLLHRIFSRPESIG